MPTNIIDVDAFTSPVVAPAGGDPRTAASVVQGLQPLANRSLYLRNRARGAHSASQLPLPLANATPDESVAAGTWIFSGSTTSRWIQKDTSNRFLVLDLDLPAGVTVTQIRVHLKAASGHGALPAVMPTVYLHTVNNTTGARADVGSQVDTSASVGVFEANHTITLTVSHVVSLSGQRYVLRIEGEGSTNSAINLDVYGADISWTAP